MTDAELMHQFATTRSESAFRELVERHLPMVYGAARRQGLDGSLADDASQAVFLILMKKGPGLGAGVYLPAWLLTVTHFVCRDIRKRAARRAKHERKAGTMNMAEVSAGQVGEFGTITPHLDTAMAALSGADRAAIVLRYFQAKSIGEVGRSMCVSEAAAQKRIERALVKMRLYLMKREVTFSLAALPLAVGWHASTSAAAPAALSGSISTTCFAAKTGGAAATLAQAAMRAMFWTRLKIVSAALVAAALVIGTVLAADLRGAGPSPVAANDPTSTAPSAETAYPATQPASEPKDVAAVKRIIAEHLTKLQDLHAEYDHVVTYNPPPELVAAINGKKDPVRGTTSFVMMGTVDHSETLDQLLPCIRYETQLVGNPIETAGFSTHISLSNGTRYEQFDEALSDHDRRGQIDVVDSAPWHKIFCPLNLVLGVQMDQGEWIAPAAMMSMCDVSETAAGIVTVGFHNGPQGENLWSFDRKNQFALLAYREKPDNYVDPAIECINEDFKSYDGQMLPSKATFRRYSFHNNVRRMIEKEVFTIHSYIIGDTANVTSNYVMTWPVGTTVLDARHNKVVTVKTQSRVITDKELERVPPQNMLRPKEE